MFSYFAYGLSIQSEIEIPEFIPMQTACDVSIYLDRNATIPLEYIEKHQSVLKITREQGILFDQNVGLFRIRDGHEIIVTPVQEGVDSLIRLYIIGTIMSILLYQRGFFVLHGSAVEFEGSAVAFVGQSGWGKSSIAAALHTKGHKIIADDVVPVSIDQGKFHVFPGFPQLKLHQEVVECLGHDKSTLVSLHPQLKKGGFRVVQNFNPDSLPLKHIYALTKDTTLGIELLPPQDALIALVRNSIPTRWFQPQGTSHFLQTSMIAKSVPIYCLRRSHDLRSLSHLAEMVKMHLTGNLQLSTV